MKFGRYPKGNKHHYILKGNKKFLQDVSKIISEYDVQAKMIPGRFSKISSTATDLRVTVNLRQRNEIIMRLKNRGWCQNFKIICRDAMIAHYILVEVKEWN